MSSSASSSSAAFKKLSPQMQRELLRHVNKNGAPSASSTKSPAAWEHLQRQRQGKLRRTLLGTLGFVGVTASFPVIAWYWIGNLSEKDGALTSAQIRRGAFNNSGSKDIGRDPDYDFATHQHKYEKGYGEITPERLPSEGAPLSKLERMMLPMQSSTMKHIDEDTLTAAAKGLPPQS